MESCDKGVSDDTYGIIWSGTTVGSSESRPCPNINGLETRGFASRRCLVGREWDGVVNVSGCESVQIANLRESGVSRDTIQN